MANNTGVFFNINDNDGIPLVGVSTDGRVLINHLYGNCLIGSTSSTGTASQPLQVTGGAYVSGNLGVGITNPGAKLNVVDNSSSDALRITQTGSGNALVVEDSTNPDSTPLIIDANGSIGIGTNSTNGHKLSLYNSSLQISNSTSTYSGLTFYYQPISDGHYITSWNKPLNIVSVSSDLIISSNRVGIGSTQPTAKLDVNGSLNVSGVSTISVNSSSDALRITQTGSGNALVVEDETNPDSSPFIVNSSGLVGVGETNPKSSLHVSGTILSDAEYVTVPFTPSSIFIDQFGSYGRIGVVGPDNSTLGQFKISQYLTDPLSGINNESAFLIDSLGNAGIGTTNPQAKLDVNGDVNISGILTASKVASGIPQNSKTSAYVLQKSDVGKYISITSGGVTVPSGIFSEGDVISIYNNSFGDQTITQGTSVTMYFSGTSITGNRTISQRGLATILCVGSNTFIIGGAGLS